MTHAAPVLPGFGDLVDLVAGWLPSCGVPDDRMRDVVDSTVGVALRLAGIVHDEDPADAAELVDGLTDEQRRVLPFVLAAMVDIDKTPGELLGWTWYAVPDRLRRVTAVAPAYVLLDQDRNRALAECGTRKGFLAHIGKGEDVCTACRIASDAWLRTRGATNAA